MRVTKVDDLDTDFLAVVTNRARLLIFLFQSFLSSQRVKVINLFRLRRMILLIEKSF